MSTFMDSMSPTRFCNKCAHKMFLKALMSACRNICIHVAVMLGKKFQYFYDLTFKAGIVLWAKRSSCNEIFFTTHSFAFLPHLACY